MKKTFLIILLFTNSFAFFAQEIYEKPIVDERVELMSIVFRLAEMNEYVNNHIPLYANEIDKYFEKHKNHQLIEYTKKLRNEYGVAYDAVADFAISLEIKKGKISFNKNIKIETLDDRWHQDIIPKYLDLLNDFYKKTKFNDFFVKNEKIRQIAEENFAKNVTDKVDFDWFKKFFRTLPEKKFRIIISLANGMHNYGPKIVYNDGTEEYYAIMGSWKADENGFPTYEDKGGSITGTLIHEICHSFCDLPVSEYLDKLLPQATIFFQLNQENFYNMACGEPMVFLHEVLVRACVFQYKKDHNIEYDFEYSKQIDDFLWIPQLLEAFEIYKNDTAYKTFIDFMPEIVKLQNSLDPQKLYDEKPIFTGTNIENGSDNVDYNIDHITVYFDKPMFVKFDMTTPYMIFFEPLAIDFSKIDKWNNEGTEWTFYVKLEPDTQYRIELPHWIFADSEHRHFAKSDYILTFKTRKE